MRGRRSRLPAALAALAVAAWPLTGCGGTTAGRAAASSPRRPHPPTTTTAPTPTTSSPTTVQPPVDGATGVGDPYFPGAGNGGYDVTAYDVALTVDPRGPDRLDATATITATATEHLRSFSLDLLGLDVGAVTVDGLPAGTARDGRELRVTPDRPLRPGRRFTVVVSYSGTPVRSDDPSTALGAGGWIDLGDHSAVLGEPIGAATWLPADDHPSDRATFRVAVTVPAGLEAVANGRLVDRTDGPTASTFTWAATEPMATYLMTVVVDDLDLVERRVPGLPPIVDAVPPSERARAERTLARYPEMVTTLAERLGPYPFDVAGNIVVRGLPPIALETQTRPVLSAALLSGTTRAEAVVVHELAHQWFGDTVTPATWRDIWLNEGFATWAEWWWLERSGGPGVLESARRAHDGGADLDVPPADPGVADMFGRSVYDRGAMFLVELERRLGPDRFTLLLRAWIARQRATPATTEDFLALAEQVAGTSLDDLSGPWLRAPELPPLSW